MLRIIVESSNAQEPAVQWLLDLLRFKALPYKVKTAKKVIDGVIYMTVFEKVSKFSGKNA